MERPKWPKEHIWEYQTTDPSMAHFIDRPILYFLTSWKSNRKISFWFDWNTEVIPKGFKGLYLEGDPSAQPIKSKCDELRMHFGMWKNVYVIKPLNEDIREWQYGFLIPGTFPGKMRVCYLKLEGPVRVLAGPEPFRVYGIHLHTPYPNEDPIEIPLQTSAMRRRNLTRNIPLI